MLLSNRVVKDLKEKLLATEHERENLRRQLALVVQAAGGEVRCSASFESRNPPTLKHWVELKTNEYVWSTRDG